MGIIAVQNFTQPTISPTYEGEGKQLRQIISGVFGINQTLKREVAATGEPGEKGWSPLFAFETVNATTIVMKIVDYVGGQGTKPSIPANCYIGATGLVAIGSAINVKGANGQDGASIKGDDGDQGDPGVGIQSAAYDSGNLNLTLTDSSVLTIPIPLPETLKGWSPSFAIHSVGEARYLKIVDYIGGEGTKPALPANVFVGSTGFVTIDNAINIRGAQGGQGIQGEAGTAAIVKGADAWATINALPSPVVGELWILTNATSAPARPDSSAAQVGDAVVRLLDGTWKNIGAFRGPKGDTGASGNSYYADPADPEAGDGNNGDFWINTTSGVLFGPKTGGAWGTGTPLTYFNTKDAASVDLDTLITSGFYHEESIESCANAPGYTGFACIQVVADGNRILQIVDILTNRTKRYSSDGGTTWTGWV